MLFYPSQREDHFQPLQDGDRGEVQVVDGVGSDRGGDRRILPFLERLVNQDSSSNEPKTDNPKPQNLERSGLQGMKSIETACFKEI